MPRLKPLLARAARRPDVRRPPRPPRSPRRNSPARRSGCWCRSRRAAASTWSPASSGRSSASRSASRCWSKSKPGAGGAIAVNELMRADPDGYTLLMTTSSHATLPALAKLPWHPSNDFTPVASIYSTMFVIATNAASTSHFRTFPSSWPTPGPIRARSVGARRASPVRSISPARSSSRSPASTWSMCPIAATGRCCRRCCRTTSSSPSTRRLWSCRTSRTASSIALAVTGEQRLPTSCRTYRR